MPDTRKRVRLVNHPEPGSPLGRPRVLVDGEPLRTVARVEIDYDHGDGQPLAVKLTLLGVDVDLEGAPDYLVKVAGPPPPWPSGTGEDGDS